jgi:hypothetical protein
MQDANTAVVALRRSRIGVLKQIIVFALQALRRLASGKPSIARVRKKNRLLHWLSVAAYLVRRIGEGALDAPRPPEPAPRTRAKGEDGERLTDWERDDDDFGLAVRNSDNFERYLKMPFASAVERLCKGVGLKPDWQAWSAEPWALAERPASLPPSPSWGGTDREAVRVGASATSPPTGDAPDFPTPAPLRGSDPPHEGEGRAPPSRPAPDPAPPLNRKARRRLAALARKHARAAA